MLLSDEQIERYSRQIIVPGFGGGGQRRLLDAAILVVGSGVAAETAAAYLTAAGVGTLGLAPAEPEEARKGTTGAAAAWLRTRNRDVCVLAHPAPAADGDDVLKLYGAALVLPQQVSAARAINRRCHLEGRPWVWGQGLRFDIQLTTFVAAGGMPCYSCIYPADPPPGLWPSSRETALFAPAAALLGALTAMEVIKIVAGIGTPLAGRMLLCATDVMRFSEVQLSKDPKCAVCGPKRR